MCVVLEFLRSLFANDGPNPVVLFFGEHQTPFFFDQLCGLVGVGIGHANEGQDREFFAPFGNGQNVLVQIFLGFGMNQDGLFAHLTRFNVEGQLGYTGTVAVHGQAGFAPDIQGVNSFQVMQFVCRVSAAIFGVSEGIPKALEFGGCFWLGKERLVGQSVAAHLSIVVHAKTGVLLCEGGPLALPA